MEGFYGIIWGLLFIYFINLFKINDDTNDSDVNHWIYDDFNDFINSCKSHYLYIIYTIGEGYRNTLICWYFALVNIELHGTFLRQ